MTACSFTVPIKPIGKARPRFTRFGPTFTPKKTARAEKTISQYAGLYCHRPMTGALRLTITAVFAVPKSWTKADRLSALSGTKPHTSKPDSDNIAKLVMDALNGIAWADDKQVVSLTVAKRYGQEEGIRIEFGAA